MPVIGAQYRLMMALRSGTASDRTPLAHKLLSVIGGPGL
jgi:hypothetical protein